MSGITEAQIAQLRKQYGDLFLVEVEGAKPGDDKIQFVFSRPDRNTLAAAAKVSQSDPFAAAEVMARNCLRWGDASSLDDVAVFSAVMTHFEVINKARVSTLKNL